MLVFQDFSGIGRAVAKGNPLLPGCWNSTREIYRGVVQVVEHLLCKCEALFQIQSHQKERDTFVHFNSEGYYI
jgi:hypothetical protein